MADIKLIKLIAGNNYDVVTMENKTDKYIVTHKTCGHKFVRSASDISLYGIHCPRCTETKSSVATAVDESHALELYKRCKSYIPSSFSLTGDTSSKENSIKVLTPQGETFTVVIEDLLDNKNLPDALARRDIATPSLALQILDIQTGQNIEIIDDFNSLDDEIRVRYHSTWVTKRVKVSDFIRGVFET